MTTVRMSVAKSESMPANPSLAKMAVRAADKAESNAHNSQDSVACLPVNWGGNTGLMNHVTNLRSPLTTFSGVRA
jgi:hypothetical protein